MKKLFDEVNSLDKRCYDKFDLTEDILMEHAASSMADFITKKFAPKTTVLIVSGAGNNGADGIALGRLLYDRYKIKLYLPNNVKSDMAKLQLQRAKKCGIKIVSKIIKADVIVDCLFGTGLSRPLNNVAIDIIKHINTLKGYKIACDIPSGIDTKGNISTIAINADITITMGGLKTALFSDIAKDYVGKIKVASLGLQNNIYQTSTNMFLLQKNDLKLPSRDKYNTHKGSFGHLTIVSGNKKGASIIAAKAAFNMGVGLLSIVTNDSLNIPSYIMYNTTIPSNTTALAIGMGLGFDVDIKKYIDMNVPMVIDADLFYYDNIKDMLTKQNIVITPHPKEFCSILSILNIANISVKQLQEDRMGFVKLFCKKYPNVVLVLKGANSIIGQKNKFYINKFGDSRLSFGGSGDVLSGIIAGLLAQGYKPKEAAIVGSLIHTLAAKKYKNNLFSLNPNRLIGLIKKL